MNWTISQTVDLAQGYTPVVWPNALMVSGDVGAHTWRLTVLDNGVPADLSGANITGSFLRADGNTVLVSGTVSGNVASVTLTNVCYAVEGKLVGTMRAVISGATVTLAAVVYTVKLLTSGDVVDPGVTYQDFTIDASPAGAYANLAALNSANPDHSKIYITLNDGKWCYYNAATDHFVAGGVYQAASIENEIKQMQLDDISVPGFFVAGSIDATTGASAGSSIRIRSNSYVPDYVHLIEAEQGFTFYLAGWNASGVFLGTWIGTQFSLGQYANAYRDKQDIDFIRSTVPGCKIKVVGQNVTIGDYNKFHLYNRLGASVVFQQIDPWVLDDVSVPALWQQGSISSLTGGNGTNENRIRTAGYIPDYVSLITSDPGYEFYVVGWDSDDVCQGVWTIGKFETDVYSPGFHTWINLDVLRKYLPGSKYKIVGMEGVTPSDYNKFHLYNRNGATVARAQTRPPLLSFIDDDGSKEALEHWDNIIGATGIGMTACLVTSWVGSQNVVSWDDVKRLQRRGVEFVSHTHGHLRLTDETEAELRADFTASQDALEAHGCNPHLLVYPYTANNETSLALVREHFRGGFAAGNLQNYAPLNPYVIRRRTIFDITQTMTKDINGEPAEVWPLRPFSKFEEMIRGVVSTGGWLILETHLYNSATAHFYCDESTEAELIEVCKMATSHGCKIVTAGEGFELFRNRIDVGSVDDDTYYIVDCNGNTHEKNSP